MELSDLAEQILFGDTLELKLAQPKTICDERPGRARRAPSQPGRPSALAFAAGGRPFVLPGLRQLEQDAARGRLLHYFANHELLATELMALALLKFPDAPKAFRHDVYRTLLDEQRHTRMYVERLKRLGLEFGQFPVNGHLWKLIAPMATPLDYVSRLSLTFEQANLDYSAHYAGLFAQAGDTASHRLLDRIHRDEIGHVGCGLRWFRHWKNPALDDWEAFQEALTFPLSPSRAKGTGFHAEARRRAGLDERFIDRLYVYAKSKGRTPGVFVFNPQAESEIGHRAGFQGRGPIDALARDVTNLPQFLASKDDVVLVRSEPRLAFQTQLKAAGFDLPQFECLDKGRLSPGSELRTRKIGRLRPWAWSPSIIEILEPLRHGQTRPVEPRAWTETLRSLYSKATGAAWLLEFLRSQPADACRWMCPAAHVGRTVHDAGQAAAAVAAFRRDSPIRLVAKAPFGLAGRDMNRLWEPEVSKAQTAWMRRVLDSQGALVIEPWLNRELEFSVQFEAENETLRQVGWVKLDTDLRGQYVGSRFTPRFTQGFDPALARFVHDGTHRRLQRAVEDLASFLAPRLAAAGFVGPLGVDMMIYRDAEGTRRWKPIVEINPRYTMGRLLLELMKRAQHGRSGQLQFHSLRRIRGQGHADFPSFAAALAANDPVVGADSSGARIRSGTVCLNDPQTALQILATWQVA